MADISRRGFIGGAAAFMGLAGCRSFLASSGRPAVSFGVISDPHITTPESTFVLERTLRYFRDRKVDAVMICGDLSDWGLLSGFKYIAEAWNRVFPGDRAADGRRVQRLFCTGNHDFEGFWYGDMTADMHAQGYSEDEALVRLGMKKCWEEAFQEEYADIRRRTVNGYDFVSAEWPEGKSDTGFRLAPAWFAANGASIDPSKPFFYFQHPPVGGTVLPGPASPDAVTAALSPFGNAVAFTGHYHTTLNCGRSIWQGAFTSISVPSLSYTSVPRGYENGGDERTKRPTRDMPIIPVRFWFEEAQGFVVSVFPDKMVVERRDFTQCEEAGAAWLVPLGGGEKPYTFEAHAARTPVPQFPEGAGVRTRITNTEDRGGHWEIVLVAEFPAADAVKGARAFDYEIRAVPSDGSEPMVKRFLSPAFHKLPKDEPKSLRFWMDVLDLPQDREYRIEVYPRNSFGVCGRPLVGAPRRGAPGGAKVRPAAKNA